MFYVLQNESTAARRRVPILLTDAATGTTAQSGVALTNIYAYININGGAFIGGTGNKGEAGFGQYYYEFEANEVATLGLAGIHITAPACRDYDAISQIAAFDLYSASAGGGISAYDVWAIDYNSIGAPGGSAGEVLNNTLTAASNAETNSLNAESQTTNIAYQVWGEELDASGNSPYQAGTAGTILYTLGQAGVALTAGDVWDYASRTITGGIADTVTLVTSPVDISYASMAGLANTIWSTDVSGYTNPSAGYDLTQAASGGLGLTAGDVWEYDISGILTAGSSGKQLNTAATPSGAGISAYDVWDFATRTITGGTADTVTTLTNPANITTSSMSGVASTVWNSLVASHSTNGTFGKNILRADAANKVGDVTLYSTGTSNGVDADMHRIANDSAAATVLKEVLTGIGGSITANITGNLSGSVGSVTADVNVSTASMTGIAGTVWSTDVSAFTSPSAGYDLTQAAAGGGITAGDVWDYVGGRTITGGLADTVTTLTNRSGFAITGGTITTVSDKTGYSLSASQAFDLAGNITGNLSGSVGSVSGAVGSVTSAVDVSTSSMSGIANTVWSTDVSGYTSPSAGFDLSNVAGGGITAGDVWSYATRTITGGIADTVTTVSGNVLGSVNSVVTDVTISTGTQASIANTVWSTDVSGYTSPSAGFDLSNASSGAGLTAGDVWSYATRTITGGIADTVTDVTNGVIVTTNNDKTGYSLSSTQTFDLTGNVSGSVGSVTADVNVSTSSMSGIADTVWNYATRTLTSTGAGISAYDVWNFDPTAMTVPQAGAILTDIASDTNTIQTDISNIPNNVWVSDVSGYTNPGEAGFELTQAALGGGGVTAGDVWSYATRTITGGIADTVTTLTNRSGFAITGGTVDTVTNGVTVSTNNDKTGYALSSTQTFDLTGNITGNLSGSVGSVTNPVTFDSAQYAGIASSVWNAATRTLTSTGAGISAFDVWNFVLSDSNTAEVDLVQAAAGNGLTAGDVWSYATRTITGGIADTVTTLTDRSGFAITGGTITTVSDKTGYSLSGSQSFNLTGNITGNLSGSVGSVTSGVTVTTNNDKTGYALSGAGVSAVQSGLSTLTQAQVGTEVDSSLSDVGLTSTVTGRIDATISSRLASASYVTPPTEAAIWSYSPRTLTSGAGATAGDVWTYPTRSLTSGAGITVSAATNIINGPYFVKSNVDGQDGNLDVIRGMVQDIILTVTDAFQNPFDVTALGMAVNFYDQAGSLVTSYGTTSLYAPGGLIQFTLDTAVTANEGRYNLILSAAGAGNTIKFGPLQTLVRPF